MEEFIGPLRFDEHKAFLRVVHSRGGDALYLGPLLPRAIKRYLKHWLPLVASEGDGARLIPPLDVAWVWHLHRLAPRRYAVYCNERFGRVLEPAAAAFKAQSAADEADGETRRLWEKHYADEPFFQRGEGESSPAEWGPRDPLSNQTTLCAEIKTACAAARSEHGFDYDVETCSARQRTFLWQVSQPAFSGSEGFAAAAGERYLQFLGLMKKHGCEEHFFVPSYDIDFVWHTHMLSSTTCYLRETEALADAPGGVDHDDSVNQRHADSKLHLGWAETKELWASEHGDAADPIDRTGVTYRGEPPDWWFEADGSDIFRVLDCFLSEEEVANALEKLSCEANVRGRAHSGFDMGCQVSGDVMRRLREQIDAEGAVEGREPAELAQPPAGQEPQQEEEQELVEVPARVCPASKSVPQHKDKPDGKGAAVGSWICVVYLTNQPGSALVLVDDVTGREFRVPVVAGRLCCWPNARFSHRVDVDAADAELASFRSMLGPMAFSHSPSKQIVYTEGGCGGGGCGGGGCGGGGGGCGGGGCAGGGGGVPTIVDSATVRVVGVSTLKSDVMNLAKGTASAAALVGTFAPSAYSAVWDTGGISFIRRRGNVPYMHEAAVSQALWQQLQQQIGELEARLAAIADLSDYPSCSAFCCGGPSLDAFKAVAALVKATRDVHVAAVNVQLAAFGVQLCFGGGNSAYYLQAAASLEQAIREAEPALQQAQAAEVAAREGLAPFGIAPPAAGYVVQGIVAGGVLEISVPEGLSGGESLQVQTPAGLVSVQIPPGVAAGQSLQVQAPLPPQSAAPVTAQPVVAQPVAPPAGLQMQRHPVVEGVPV